MNGGALRGFRRSKRTLQGNNSFPGEYFILTFFAKDAALKLKVAQKRRASAR